MEGVSSLYGANLPPLPGDIAAPPPLPTMFSPQMQFGVNAAAPGMRPDGIPKFFLQVVRKPDGTYENVEYVELITPGDPKAAPVRKVNDHLRMKYRQYYELWKRDQTMAPVGSPLEMWPRMTPAMVHQLRAANIFTVEQLAAVSDDNLRHVAFGITLRKEARQWVEAKEKSDVIEQATAQTQAMQDSIRAMEDTFAREKSEMKAENADLKSKLDAILARLGAPETPVAASGGTEPAKRGPGRPRASEAA